MATKPLLSLGSFLGVNNRLDPTRLGVTLQGRVSATYLRIAENVDLDGGFLRLRPGFGEVRIDGARQVWGDGKDDGYGEVDGDLAKLKLTPGGLAVESVVRYGVGPAPLSFDRAPTGDVVWTNGSAIGRISGGVDRLLAPPAPNPAPAATVIGGGLPAGRYLVAFTRLTVDGESAATPAQVVTLGEPAGIHVEPLAADTVVYLSGPNGDILTRQTTTGDITALDGTGPRCETLLLAPLPAGQIVRHYNGRMLVARGSMLLFSEPYRYGLYNPGQSFIPMPGDITVVEPCVGGVFVCADKTYWLAGDLLNTQAVPVLPFGGVAGSGARNPDATQVCWLSPKGLVIGASDGTATAVQDDALRFSGAERGACLFRDWDGMSHVIYTRQGVEPNTTAARRRPLLQETCT